MNDNIAAREPQSHNPNHRFTLPKALVPVAAALVLAACQTGPRPELVDAPVLPEKTEEISAETSGDIADSQETAPNEYTDYITSPEREEALSEFVVSSVNELYRLAERDPLQRFSIVGKNDDKANPNDRPFLVLDGTIGNTEYRIVSFGRHDPRAIYRTEDGAVNFAPETIDIYMREVGAPDEEFSTSLFIGNNSTDGSKATSYVVLRTSEDGGSRFYDQASVMPDGIYSESRNVTGTKGGDSGPIADAQTAENVDAFVQGGVNGVVELFRQQLTSS